MNHSSNDSTLDSCSPNGCSYCNVQTHLTKRSVCTCIQATTICVSGLTRQVCTERQVGHLSGSSICLHNQPARFLLCSITALVDTLISPFWDCNHRSALVGRTSLCLLAVSHDVPNKATRLGSIYLTWNAARWICMYSSQLDAESILKKQPVNKHSVGFFFSLLLKFLMTECSTKTRE